MPLWGNKKTDEATADAKEALQPKDGAGDADGEDFKADHKNTLKSGTGVTFDTEEDEIPSIGQSAQRRTLQVAQDLAHFDKDDFADSVGQSQEKMWRFGSTEQHEIAARKLFALQVGMGFCGFLVAITCTLIVWYHGESSKILGAHKDDSPQLIYLNGMGNAEVVRLAFSFGMTKFCQTLIADDKWSSKLQDISPEPRSCMDLAGRAFKVTGDVPVPIIVHGDFRVAGTLACAEYAAELGLNYLVRQTSQQKSVDEMMVLAHIELLDFLKLEPKEVGTKFCDKLKSVEGFYQDIKKLGRQKKPYLYSSRVPSLGDLAIFSVLNMGPPTWHAPKEHDCYDLSQLPHLEKMWKAVNESTVFQWYQQPTRVTPTCKDC